MFMFSSISVIVSVTLNLKKRSKEKGMTIVFVETKTKRTYRASCPDKTRCSDNTVTDEGWCFDCTSATWIRLE